MSKLKDLIFALVIALVVYLIIAGSVAWFLVQTTDYSHLQEREIQCSAKYYTCLDKYPSERHQKILLEWTK